MKEIDEAVLAKVLSELDLPSYNLGTELGSAFSNRKTGLVFLRSIFEIEGMADRVMSLGPEIKECNIKHAQDPKCSCVKELKEKRAQIGKDITAHGVLFNSDVFDNFWDHLPGD